MSNDLRKERKILQSYGKNINPYYKLKTFALDIYIYIMNDNLELSYNLG